MLAALTKSDVFAAGISSYGIGDLAVSLWHSDPMRSSCRSLIISLPFRAAPGQRHPQVRVRVLVQARSVFPPDFSQCAILSIHH